MTPERWRQVNDLFHAALEREGAARQQLLDRTATADPQLAAEVRSLLAAHESQDGTLEKPAWAHAAHLLLDRGLEPGALVGSYRIVRELGRGGMGVVYEAEDTRLQRQVALKALPPDLANDPVRRERLTREARAAAALAHPAVATVYALEEMDGALYLASELVRGSSLREEIGSGALPVERLLPTLIDIAAGLSAAHAAGIVHRDLKPENIVRCTDGHVKILDFGLAQMNDEHAVTQLRLTQTGVAIGTPGYMAPEQLAGEHVDARTDVFAFGVVALELATGAHPFGTSAAELLGRITDLVDGRTLDTITGLPVRGLEPILRRCLRRDPADRYASARPVLEDIEKLLSSPDRPAQADTSRGDHAALSWWRTHQAALAIVVASMPVACWFVRQDSRVGSLIFLAVLALSTISVTIRLNLIFTSRVHLGRLAAQRARVYPSLAAAEAALGIILLSAAALVAGPRDALAAVLVTLAVATVASLGIIEPATTAAALGDDAGSGARTR